MSGVDMALIFAFVACALRGYWRGFLRETFSVLALIGGMAAAVQWTNTAAAALHVYLPRLLSPVVQTGLAFVAIFSVVHAAITVAGSSADRLAGAQGRVMTRLSGALLGMVKGGAVLAVILLFLHLFPLVSS